MEANRTFEVVRRLFNWAIEEEILRCENPAFKLSKPAEETPRERTLTADELQTLWLRIGRCEPDRARGVSADAAFGTAPQRGLADAMGRSRSPRWLVEHAGRGDQRRSGHTGFRYAGDARHRRRNSRSLSLDSRVGIPARRRRRSRTRDERHSAISEVDQGCRDSRTSCRTICCTRSPAT